MFASWTRRGKDLIPPVADGEAVLGNSAIECLFFCNLGSIGLVALRILRSPNRSRL